MKTNPHKETPTDTYKYTEKYTQIKREQRRLNRPEKGLGEKELRSKVERDQLWPRD